MLSIYHNKTAYLNGIKRFLDTTHRLKDFKLYTIKKVLEVADIIIMNFQHFECKKRSNIYLIKYSRKPHRLR
jgi:hypothetical protein